MNHGDLEELLSKIDGVWKKEQAHQIELLDRGEKYNIFNILGMATKEVRLHSAFIANLLNPKGEHGCGDLFLTNFLTLVLKQQIPHKFKTKEIQCYVEYYIGPASGEYGGRIDILVQDSTYALIIENKIYAKDQTNQLKRYDHYGKQSGKKYHLVYLTLFGNDAGEHSSSDVENYLRCSYEKDILDWLTKCHNFVKDKPKVVETLKQYIEVIEELTYQKMNDPSTKKVAELAIDHLDQVVPLLLARNEIAGQLHQRYIKTPLEEYAKENGAELHLKGYAIEYRKAGWQRAITIQLQGDNYYIGIPSTDPNIERLESLGKQSPHWMYGWEWLPIYDWWDPNNFKSIQEGTVYKWIVEKIETIEKELRTKRINL